MQLLAKEKNLLIDKHLQIDDETEALNWCGDLNLVQRLERSIFDNLPVYNEYINRLSDIVWESEGFKYITSGSQKTKTRLAITATAEQRVDAYIITMKLIEKADIVQDNKNQATEDKLEESLEVKTWRKKSNGMWAARNATGPYVIK